MSIVALKVGPNDQGLRMTIEEFEEAEVEEGYQYELEQGALLVAKSPGVPHAQVWSNLSSRVGAYVVARLDVVLRYETEISCRLVIPEDQTIRHPDLGIVLRGAPDLRSILAEIVSPSARDQRRDYEHKRADYWRYGAMEYWIIDRFRREVTVLTRDGGTDWAERVLGSNDVLTTPLLPGFALRVADLWADLDAEEAE